MKIAFFQTEDWEQKYIEDNLKLSTAGEIDAKFFSGKLDKDNIPDQKDFDIISVFVGSKLDKDVIDSFPNLKLITTRSTGFDHIDLATAAGKNILTGYVPGYGDNTVAEFAFGLILALSRKIYAGIDRIKETGDFSFEGLRGFDLLGKTIGVVGTGRIGQHSIKIAKGFGMNVIAYDAFPNQDLANNLGFQYVSLDDLLAQSDVITLHVPYIPSASSGQVATHHLINSENISKIKKGAILINTARGPIIETDALVKALNDGILSGVGLDVLEEEAFIQEENKILNGGHPDGHDLKIVAQDHVLMKMPNVLITPHNAFNTTEALKRILDTDVANIKSFIEKGEVVNSIPGK